MVLSRSDTKGVSDFEGPYTSSGAKGSIELINENKSTADRAVAGFNLCHSRGLSDKGKALMRSSISVTISITGKGVSTRR
jgi:hypothetical protein